MSPPDLTKTSRKLQLSADTIQSAQKWLERSGRFLKDAEKHRMLAILVREYSTGRLDLDGLVNAVAEIILDFPRLLPELLAIFQDKPRPILTTGTSSQSSSKSSSKKSNKSKSSSSSKSGSAAKSANNDHSTKATSSSESSSKAPLQAPSSTSVNIQSAEKSRDASDTDVKPKPTTSNDENEASEQKVSAGKRDAASDADGHSTESSKKRKLISSQASTTSSSQGQQTRRSVTPPSLNMEYIKTLSEQRNSSSEPEFGLLTPIEENHWEHLLYIIRSVERHKDARDLFSTSENHPHHTSALTLDVLEQRCINRDHYVTLNEFRDDIVRVLDHALYKASDMKEIPAAVMNVRRHLEYLWSYYFPNFDGGRGKRRSSPVVDKLPSPLNEAVASPFSATGDVATSSDTGTTLKRTFSITSSASPQSTSDSLSRVEPDVMYAATNSSTKASTPTKAPTSKSKSKKKTR